MGRLANLSDFPVLLAVFGFLLLSSTVWSSRQHPPLRNLTNLKKREDTLYWAVIGDSWASGVAFNSSNVYGRTDREFCYRSKESWGAQMKEDTSWFNYEAFQFAACGGTLMSDLKRQMREKVSQARVILGMFGGNNAYFGDIARACIYQPYSLSHPFGWGPAWDEDPEAKGLCKKNIAKAEEQLNEPEFWRAAFTGALDDVFWGVQRFDEENVWFYVSSYVRFFDDSTDGCDDWSFAHQNVSSGFPRLVKGLRKIINEKVLQVNSIQLEVIQNYKLPVPSVPNYHLGIIQPDSLFDGHRFCERDRTFEDQFYHPDLWLWNLQYYDEKQGDEVGIVKTNNDGVTFMASPEGIDILTDFKTVLGQDSNPAAAFPEGSAPNPQQFGFGWTARPFHPKYVGNTALKNFFIQRLKDDGVEGVKRDLPPKEETPPPVKRHECHGLGSNKYISREAARDIIEAQFCPEAVNNGPIEHKYLLGTPEEILFKLDSPLDFKPTMDDCVTALLHTLIDGCDGNDPTNPENYKGGGKQWHGDVVYEVTPLAPRQPAERGKQGGCSKDRMDDFVGLFVWGHGWANSDFGKEFEAQIKHCFISPNSWQFNYGLGDDGREWTAQFMITQPVEDCVISGAKSAGAPEAFDCKRNG